MVTEELVTTWIKNAVDLYRQNDDCDSVITVQNIEGNRPEWMLSIDDKGRVLPYATPFEDSGKPVIKLAARQSFPTLYRQNGLVYVTDKNLLMEKTLTIRPNALAVIVDEGEAVDIDTFTDFYIAESLMKMKS